MLDLAGCNLRYWPSLYPLHEILYGNHKVFHLPYRQREWPQNIDSPSMERPRAIDRSEIFSWRLVLVSVLLTLLALLCIPSAIFPYGWLIISRTNGLWCERSATDMTPTYPFMEFCHYSCALLATYTYQNRVGKPVSEQFPVNEGVFAQIFLYFSGLCGFQWDYPISQVTLVGCHPGFSSFNQVNLQRHFPKTGYMLILGVFNVSWVNDRWLLFLPSDVLTWWTSTKLSAVKVPWMTVLCLPPCPNWRALLVGQLGHSAL